MIVTTVSGHRFQVVEQLCGQEVMPVTVDNEPYGEVGRYYGVPRVGNKLILFYGDQDNGRVGSTTPIREIEY